MISLRVENCEPLMTTATPHQDSLVIGESFAISHAPILAQKVSEVYYCPNLNLDLFKSDHSSDIQVGHNLSQYEKSHSKRRSCCAMCPIPHPTRDVLRESRGGLTVALPDLDCWHQLGFGVYGAVRPNISHLGVIVYLQDRAVHIPAADWKM